MLSRLLNWWRPERQARIRRPLRLRPESLRQRQRFRPERESLENRTLMSVTVARGDIPIRQTHGHKVAGASFDSSSPKPIKLAGGRGPRSAGPTVVPRVVGHAND